MTPIAVLAGILAAVLGLAVAVLMVIYLVVPFFKGIGWLIRHIFRFVSGIIVDALRLVGSIVMAVFYVPLILVNIIIGRWSASGHFGRSLTREFSTMGLCLYRIAVGHPLRLFGMGGVVEGVENRLPAALAAAPTADVPAGGSGGGRAGQFDGYRIVGSLAPGGSGAKLYIADVEASKRSLLSTAPDAPDVDQVVIKAFSLKDGSSLPQIVRESRSLDAAKKLGLILDHQLTPERFYYVMRYVPGESLAAMTKSLHAGSPSGGLDEPHLRSALSYASDLIATLAVYHRGGLWHKDVKPDNIIIDENGRAHLVDFGLVSSLRSAMTLTTHGTEYFRDPEMVRLALRGVKVHEVDGTRFDIYGAGAVLYSLIEDSFPAHGALSKVTRRCPESVKWIIRRAMTDYDKRYASSDAMLADLESVRRAQDPFGVRPADLPSVRGNFDDLPSDEPCREDAAGSPVPPPMQQSPPVPVAAVGVLGSGPGASPSGRTAPLLEVTNWWSGATRIIGERAPAPRSVPATPAEAGRMAGHWARENARAAGEAAKGAWAGLRGHPPHPGARRPAQEQIAAARGRVEARRARVRTARVIPGRAPGSGFNPGVAFALLIFLGAVVGVVAKVSGPSNAFEDDAAQVTLSSQEAHAHSDMEAPPPVASGRVLVVNDVLGPWDDEVKQRIESIASHLNATGLTPHGLGLAGGDSIVETIAAARLALGRVSLDDPHAESLLREWLATSDAADALVWIAPSGIEGDPTPRIFAFMPESTEPEGTPRVQAVKWAIRPR